MEEKLLALVGRIESSDLLDTDKEHLYVQIRHALEAAVVPIVIARLPKDTLHSFTQNLPTLSSEAYIRFIAEAMQGDAAINEVEQSMTEVLDIIAATLTEAGVT